MVTFIGDVHGWSDRLERLLAKADGEYVFVGDLIDRGPDAPGVLKRVRELCEGGRARCLMGNHEYAMVRGMGVPELGIPAFPTLFTAWVERYGGEAVLKAYDLTDADPEKLRARLGGHVNWLAQLPWMLQGEGGGKRWIAVHAGLGSTSYSPQVEYLRDAMTLMRRKEPDMPPPLYAKPRAFLLPEDLPEDTCVVSGHTPFENVMMEPQRILCDTSGGMPGRPLSGVIWPERRVISS
jgi:hypothetical protein